jgi:DNA-binding response OmpR family regulator
MTRVLLAGTDTSVTGPLARAMTAEGYQPTVVDTGPAALQRAVDGFRILVLDVELPEISGLEVCRRLRLDGYNAPVILVAPEGADDMALTVLETGGDDVVAKPFRMGDLFARMRALLRRGGMDATVASNGLRLDVSGRRAWVDGEEVKLTAKEFELLRVLVREAGNVVSREDLLKEVWDTDWFSSTKTIDMHMSWLRRKLGDSAHDPRYIRTIRGVGFRFERPAP